MTASVFGRGETLRNIRETEKKERELRAGRRLAQELNRIRGTDYEAIDSDNEPADVLLKSSSEKHPEIPIQVVSIPLGGQHRNDNDSVTKTKQALIEALVERGLKHCSIDLAPTLTAKGRRLPALLLPKLADMILHESQRGTERLNYTQIRVHALELADYFDYVLIFCHRAIPNVTVDIISGDNVLPPDGRWIQEGIEKKLAKYGGAGAVKDLTLLIDISGIVDQDQIASFMAAHPGKTLPFSEIWIWGLQEITCLKNNRSTGACPDQDAAGTVP